MEKFDQKAFDKLIENGKSEPYATAYAKRIHEGEVRRNCSSSCFLVFAMPSVWSPWIGDWKQDVLCAVPGGTRVWLFHMIHVCGRGAREERERGG
jgi:hypothetical protein